MRPKASKPSVPVAGQVSGWDDAAYVGHHGKRVSWKHKADAHFVDDAEGHHLGCHVTHLQSNTFTE